MGKKIKHEALGLEFELPDHELKQRDIEAFYAAMPVGARGSLAPIRNGHVVRAAISCGWLEGQLTDDELADMHPAGVTWLAGEIDTLVFAAYEIPGE